MKANLDEFIRELSEVYDSDSIDSYVSVYLNKQMYKKFLDKREKACKSVLKGKQLENFEKSFSDIISILKKMSWNNIAVFASHKHDFLKYVVLSVDVKKTLIVDSSPYLRPLARIQDEWESFTLLLISSNYAKIFTVSLGKIEHEKKLTADVMKKHKKGGMSQMRFNRLRRGAIQAFFSEVIEELQSISDKQIIIAGPGTAKNQFLDMLPKNISDNVLDVMDISVDDENELLGISISLVSQIEEQKSYRAVQLLKQEILKDGLATYGVNETLKAVKNGQVELLLIEKDFRPSGWICENCQFVDEGSKSTCPYCGKKTSKVDVIEEILEFAKRTDAEIEFTDTEDISKLGHIGAILRFK